MLLHTEEQKQREYSWNCNKTLLSLAFHKRYNYPPANRAPMKDFFEEAHLFKTKFVQ